MKKIYALSLFCLFMILSSCKTEGNKSNERDDTQVSQNEQPQLGELAYKDAQVIISKPSGENIGGFTLNPLTVYADGKKYFSKNKSEKHKYYYNGAMAFEVKFKSESFKLRDKNSNLLWKIKLYPDKIKIADNEENENAFQIKKYDEKIKVKRNDEEVYSIKLQDSSIIVNKEMLYKISSDEDSYAYAIMAIKEIPEGQRIAILAELLGKL